MNTRWKNIQNLSRRYKLKNETDRSQAYLEHAKIRKIHTLGIALRAKAQHVRTNWNRQDYHYNLWHQSHTFQVAHLCPYGYGKSTGRAQESLHAFLFFLWQVIVGESYESSNSCSDFIEILISLVS